MEESRTIEQRLLAVEDHIAIGQLVGAYGYAIDGRNKDVLGRIYAEDGVYAVGDTGTFAGREAIQAIADMPGHIALVEAGCAHISTNPQIVIDGDRASATCHTMVGAHGDGGFFIWRLSASQLMLSRKPEGGWQIDHRQNYLLQGDPEGPALLARAADGPAPA
ncbi:nuclear transport factor 2 family protein [Sphingomonas bacterium]|uniref:nuclear transport factor 2 family protein n=1 Tax=Sphingomonas bacterium TaxID=1895847 RepID=UPI0015774517|nr:nuclear transport factor 2 family protein [Sphingomonas bacterium]